MSRPLAPVYSPNEPEVMPLLFVLSAPLIPGTALLGINTNSPEHLWHMTERGFDAQVVDALAPHLGLRPADLLAILKLRVSSPASRRQYPRRLSSQASIHLFRLAYLADGAHAHFDSPTAVHLWLRTPDATSDGQTPLERAVGMDGIAYVGRTLARIRLGEIRGAAPA